MYTAHTPAHTHAGTHVHVHTNKRKRAWLIGKFTSPARAPVLPARDSVPWREAHYVEGTGARLQLHRKQLTGLCLWTAKQSWTRRKSCIGLQSILARSFLFAVNQKACIMHNNVPSVKLQGIISKSMSSVYKKNVWKILGLFRLCGIKCHQT